MTGGLTLAIDRAPLHHGLWTEFPVLCPPCHSAILKRGEPLWQEMCLSVSWERMIWANMTISIKGRLNRTDKPAHQIPFPYLQPFGMTFAFLVLLLITLPPQLMSLGLGRNVDWPWRVRYAREVGVLVRWSRPRLRSRTALRWSLSRTVLTMVEIRAFHLDQTLSGRSSYLNAMTPAVIHRHHGT